MTKYDPWGPISTILFQTNDSDAVLDSVEMTGVSFNWPTLTTNQEYSNSTRIRAYRPSIMAAYDGLNDEEKGRFSQIVVKALLGRHDAAAIREKLETSLADIGWQISAEGLLFTDDALIAEQFFAPNTQFDAYIAIRDVLSRAQSHITIVDGYLGTRLFSTLRTCNPTLSGVYLLTVARHLPGDFATEAGLFRSQFPQINVEVRSTTDFHDRFIAIDGTEFYFVGASIKDAGRKAFMISRVQDQRTVAGVQQAIDDGWSAGLPLAV